MTHNNYKIALLRVLILSYSLLTESGFKLRRPIAVISGNEEEQEILWQKLLLFPEEQKLIPLTVKPKELEQNWKEAEYGVFYCNYIRGRYSNQNLERLSEWSQTSGGGIEKQKLILIFASGCLAKEVEVEGSLYFTDLSDVPKTEIDTRAFVQYLISNEKIISSSVMEEIEHIQTTFAVLNAAKLILEKFILREISTEEIPEFLKRTSFHQEKIYEEWEETENSESYVVALYRMISEHVDLLPPVLNRERVEAQDMEWIDKAIFYDDEAYYLPEQFFHTIYEKHISSVNTTYIKAKLAEAGVLAAEGRTRKYFTKKIEVVTVYGAIIKARRMKILRKKFDCYGEFTLQELSLMREEETYECEEWEDCETWEA